MARAAAAEDDSHSVGNIRHPSIFRRRRRSRSTPNNLRNSRKPHTNYVHLLPIVSGQRQSLAYLFGVACGDLMATNNIVLVHGLWLTPLSWEYWAHHYTELGYSVYAPSWP